MCKSIHLTLNHIQTHLLTWGNPFDANGKDVIISITGNPGLPDFYKEFASVLHQTTGYHICVIGQAGHEEVADDKSNILKGQEHFFDLRGQIQHKVDLIMNHIDKNSRLHIIGHSIGAWIIIELLQQNEHLINRIFSINLLFPTIQKMADSTQGIIMNKIVRRLHVLIMLLLTLLLMLPDIILSYLINFYIKINSLQLFHKESVKKILNRNVLEKVLFLAYNEMDNVKDLNVASIDKIKHLTNIIYSNHDNWAPVHYMDDLHRFKPSIQMKAVDIDHSFVLQSSETVAEMVAVFIKTKTDY